MTATLLRSRPDCRVTAVDFSEAMLRKGRENIPDGLHSNVEFLVADAMKLDFPQATFDAVMSAYGLRNLDSNEVVLPKIRNVLRPGGKLVILEFFRPEGIVSRLFNRTYSEFIIPIVGRAISRHPEAYRHLRDSVRNFYTPTEYRELLQEIGFQNVEVKPQTGGISHLITAEAVS